MSRQKKIIAEKDTILFETSPNVFCELNLTDGDKKLMKIGNKDGLIESIIIRLEKKFRTSMEDLTKLSDDIHSKIKPLEQDIKKLHEQYITDIEKVAYTQVKDEIDVVKKTLSSLTTSYIKSSVGSSVGTFVDGCDTKTEVQVKIKISSIDGNINFTNNKSIILEDVNSTIYTTDLDSYNKHQAAKLDLEELENSLYEVNDRISKLLVLKLSIKDEAEYLANEWILNNVDLSTELSVDDVKFDV